MKKIILIIGILFVILGCTNSKEKNIYREEEIIAAIAVDNTQILNDFLNKGFPKNYIFRDGNTPLTLALKDDSINSIKLLISKGVDLNKPIMGLSIPGVKNKMPAQTPIFYAKSLKSLDLLLNNGADINVINSEGDPLITYFIKYRPIEYSIYLIDRGVDLNIEDKTGWTPIFWGATNGNRDLIEAIYKINPAILDTLDRRQNYPIYYAYNEEIILALLKGNYNLEQRNVYGENVLGEVYLKAVGSGYREAILKIWKKGIPKQYKSYGENALDIAENNNQTSIIKLLKENGL